MALYGHRKIWACGHEPTIQTTVLKTKIDVATLFQMFWGLYGGLQALWDLHGLYTAVLPWDFNSIICETGKNAQHLWFCSFSVK